MVGRAVGRQVVDEAGEDRGEHRARLIRGDAGLLREARQAAVPEDALDLLTGDRQVLAGADPGLDEVAQALLLEELDEAPEASGLAVAEEPR